MDYDFRAVARLPSPDDNVAIATQTLEVGTHIHLNGQEIPVISHHFRGTSLCDPANFRDIASIVLGSTLWICHAPHCPRRLRLQSEND